MLISCEAQQDKMHPNAPQVTRKTGFPTQLLGIGRSGEDGTDRTHCDGGGSTQKDEAHRDGAHNRTRAHASAATSAAVHLRAGLH